MNLFLEKQKIKFVEKLKTERIKTQMNNKNVIYPLGKKEKWLLKITTRKFIFLWFSDCPVPERNQMNVFPKCSMLREHLLVQIEKK